MMGKTTGVLALSLVILTALSTVTLVMLEAGDISYSTSSFVSRSYIEEKQEKEKAKIIPIKKNMHYEEIGRKAKKIAKETTETIQETVQKIIEMPKEIAFYNNVEDTYYSSNISVPAGEQYMDTPSYLNDYYTPMAGEKFAVYSTQLGVIDSKTMEITKNFTKTASNSFSNPLGADTYGTLRNAQVEIDRRLVMQPGETDHYKFIYTIKNNGGPYFKDKTRYNVKTGKKLITPKLIDLDGDNDLDMAIGDMNGKIYYYENTGQGFVQGTDQISQSFSTVSVHTYQGGSDYKVSPTFADLDNDGDQDLILGTAQGYLGYYENTGTNNNPEWTSTDKFGFLNMITPYDAEFQDFDNDGDLDMMIANLYNLVYYENTGTGWNKVFNETFGITTMVFRSIESTDLDEDGDYDLLIGTDLTNSLTTNNIIYLENIGNANNPSFKISNDFSINHGDMLKLSTIETIGLATGDLDKDGKEDLLIGNNDGTTTYYKKGAGKITDLYFYEIALIDFIQNSAQGNITYDPSTDSFTSYWKYQSYPAGAVTMYGDIQSAKHGIQTLQWYYPYRWQYAAQCSATRFDNSEDLYWTDGELNSMDNYKSATAPGQMYTCTLDQYTNMMAAPTLGFYIGNLSAGEEKTITITYRYSAGKGGRNNPDLSVKNINFIQENITFELVNDGGSSAETEVKIINLDTGAETTITRQAREHSTTEVSLSFNVKKKQTAAVIADPDDKIYEDNENNNALEKQRKKYDVSYTLDVMFPELFEEYLQERLVDYNIVQTGGDYHLYIGGNYTGDGIIEYYRYRGNLPYNGIAHASGVNRKNIYITGVNIDGTIAALKYADWNSVENSEHYVDRDDPEGLKVNDLFRKPANKPHLYKDNAQFKEIVRQALFGKYTESNESIKTLQGVELRLKHLINQNDDLVKEYLGLPTYPVVMAGGLWSDINAWKGLGQELADDGRDVWLAEITGGPNTECSTCADYTYNDLVNYHIPAIVGGVVQYTGQPRIQWVGHSNGGRSALDFLTAYSATGLNPAGLYWNGASYQYDSFGPNVVETYIGAGVPGAFSELSYLANQIKNKGDETIQEFKDEDNKHITLPQLAIKNYGIHFLITVHGYENKVKTYDLGNLINVPAEGIMSIAFGKNKISLNLFNQYFNWINSTQDEQPGKGLALDNFAIIGGDLNTRLINGGTDGIVAIDDEDAIYENIILNEPTGNNTNTKRFFNVMYAHIGMSDYSIIKNLVQKSLNKEELNVWQRIIELIKEEEKS